MADVYDYAGVHYVPDGPTLYAREAMLGFVQSVEDVANGDMRATFDVLVFAQAYADELEDFFNHG